MDPDPRDMIRTEDSVMVTVENLLASLRASDVRLWIDGALLRYEAPRGELTPQEMENLRNRKTEIIEYLSRSQLSFETLLRGIELDREDEAANSASTPYRELLKIVKPWVLRRTQWDFRKKEVEFHIGRNISEPLQCPACGLECQPLDESQKTWRHLKAPFLTLVRAYLPRCICLHHGINTFHPSWLDSSTDFIDYVDPTRGDAIQQSSISAKSILQREELQRLYIMATRTLRPIADLVRRPLIDRALAPVTCSSSAIDLPFDEDPPYRTYHCLAAHPLGILAAVSDIRPLLASDYINVSCGKSPSVGLCIVPWRPIGHFVSDGHCEIMDVPDDLTFKAANSRRIVEWLVDMISNRWYLFLHVNKYYIPNTWPYLKQDFLHDCLVVGFDGRKQLFKVAMYLSSGRYAAADVPFTDLVMALTMRGSEYFLADSICFDLAAVAVRPRDALRFRFDRTAACRHLRDYLLSLPPEDGIFARDNLRYAGDRCMTSGYPQESCLYGVNAIVGLVGHLKARVQENLRIEMTDPRALWEIKKVMRLNLKFWLTQPCMFGIDCATDRYSEVVAWAHRLFYLCFSYNQQPRETSRDLLLHLDKSRAMLEMEQEILGRLLLRMTGR